MKNVIPTNKKKKIDSKNIFESINQSRYKIN